MDSAEEHHHQTCPHSPTNAPPNRGPAASKVCLIRWRAPGHLDVYEGWDCKGSHFVWSNFRLT